MKESKKRIEEIEAMMTQMEHEMEILAHAVDEIDREYDREYTQAIIRSQLQQIGEQVEAFSEIIGEGPALSVSDVPTTDEDIEKEK